MSRFDRLSSLMQRFSLSVTPVAPERANLVIFENRELGQPSRIVMTPLDTVTTAPQVDETIMFSALTEWGGRHNPLFATMPGHIEIDIQDATEMTMLVQLLKAESEAQRCGVNGALNRLGEVLMIRILRHQIERGATATGLLGGLADARLSKAIVSMHENPGRDWKNDHLASIAGLSRSRFSELFHQRVGESPQAYLRRWRMLLARQDIQRGDRIQSVAARYGYGSSEALTRAFQRQFGSTPISLRPTIATAAI